MYRPRSYAEEGDLPAILALLEACEVADQFGEPPNKERLETDLANPNIDLAQDVRLWHNEQGQLAAFAMLWVLDRAQTCDGFLASWMHPDAREPACERDVLDWAVEHMRYVTNDQGKPHTLHARPRDTQHDRIVALEGAGFTRDRYFWHMSRALIDFDEQPRFSPDFIVREVRVAEEGEAWVRLYNDAFSDHWNHRIVSFADYTNDVSEPTYRNDLDLVVEAPDGTLAGFCVGDQSADGKRGEIIFLGTRRAYRQQGLGRALLLEGLRRLKASGAESATLEVDADSPTNATSLYESVGFTVESINVSYGLAIPTNGPATDDR